ncbi:hypothetical protein PLICRDRAFT_172593 [Plicaturopsis crispa FD-325 SS-3]|nr:hypothetical protein PLICRDRAFT_172593 [Plicaturopsis crispa FD-325 SS-3]
MDEIQSAVRDVLIQNYAHFVAFVILYYDHFWLTLSDEIQFIWAHPKTLSSVVFLLNRYVAAAGNIAVVALGSFALTPQRYVRRTEQYSLFRQLLLLINQLLVSVLLLLRTYALYGRDKRLLFGLSGFGVIVMAGGLGVFFLGNANNGNKVISTPPVSGCHGNHTTTSYAPSLEPHTTDRLISGLSPIQRNPYAPPPFPQPPLTRRTTDVAAPWEALLLWDIAVFGLTLARTLTSRTRDMLTRERLPLALLVLRDGALYFGVMALATLANVLTFYLSPPLLKGFLSTLASSFEAHPPSSPSPSPSTDTAIVIDTTFASSSLDLDFLDFTPGDEENVFVLKEGDIPCSFGRADAERIFGNGNGRNGIGRGGGQTSTRQSYSTTRSLG